MSTKDVLKLDWATHKAASYACKHWHYSQCMPAGKTVKIGVWENNVFIGVVIFSWGATSALVKQYGLKMIEGCELTRIALNKHQTSVSRIMSIAIKFLKKQSPGLRLIVSFADPNQGHHGGVYQAGNWIYCGKSSVNKEYVYRGKRYHGRSFRQLGISEKRPDVQIVLGSSKHRYLMPLDSSIKKMILKLQQKYPKRVGSIENDALADQAREGGVSPTPTLQ